jgi:predicted negative regulator of RcsB-dependent stress response
MAAYDLEEQEQLDELKAWWKQYGNLLTGVVLAGAIGIAGWQGWNWYQRNQSAEASAIYAVLQRAAGERDMQRVKAASGELLEKYSGSAYAPLAALTAGKIAYDNQDLKTAKVQLAWAIDHADGEIKDLARLRLAAVLLDEKSFDEALKLVQEPAAPAFAARFADIRGDILLAQGKRAEAKAAYQSVLQKNEASLVGGKIAPSSGLKEMVQQKLDALGDA